MSIAQGACAAIWLGTRLGAPGLCLATPVNHFKNKNKLSTAKKKRKFVNLITCKFSFFLSFISRLVD